MSALARLEVVVNKRTASDIGARIPRSGDPATFFAWLASFFAGLASYFGVMVRLALDESSPVAATGTVVFTQASLTAGDKVIIQGVAYTAVAGAADATLGQFSIDTSDTAVGDSFVLALAAYPRDNGGPRPICSGVNTAGSVALTWGQPGIVGNNVVMQEKDASGGIAITTFSGGREAGSLAKITGTFTGVPADGGTLTIGGVVLTVAAAPANESQFDGGATAAEAGANIVACINAHTKLKGLVVAVDVGSGVVSYQLQMAGRVGNLVSCLDGMTNYTHTATSFAPAGTEAWARSPVVSAIGSASASPQA